MLNMPRVSQVQSTARLFRYRAGSRMGKLKSKLTVGLLPSVAPQASLSTEMAEICFCLSEKEIAVQIVNCGS